MKKFIFPIFAICVYGPSFANVCNGDPVIKNNRLLCQDKTQNDKVYYILCDQETDDRWMIGCDGKIYECDNARWEEVESIKSCGQGWDVKDRVKPANTTSNPTEDGYIYFLNPDPASFKNSICRYTTEECNNDYDKCIKDGKVPTNCTICNPSSGGQKASQMCIVVKDDQDKNILNVDFLYNGFKIPNNQKTSIATYDSTQKCYSIEWHPDNMGNITISAQGYRSITKEVNQLLHPNNQTIILEKGTTSDSTQSTLNAPSQSEQMTLPETPADACEYSGGRYGSDNQCYCDSNKHLEKHTLENASEYTICTCMRGYKRKNAEMDTNGNTTWYPKGNECVDAGDYETHEEFDSAAWRRDTEDAYRNEYDNAQSWANKGVTGLSTLMTGEGGKMAAQAWAEQIADRDAETEMADYLAGMRCEYGNGNTVKLGDETNLPGGNELANYYAEYKTLADKLKTTKAALNLRSGIEAEVLYDRAETGLYQYRVAEIATGDNVSLARALMNPDGDDATKWNAQKTATQNKLITGGVLAATGVVAGYAANQYVNRNHEKKYKDLTMTFTEIKEQIEQKYPEIFTPTQVKPVVVEVIETPEKPDEPTIVVEIPLSASEKTFNKNIGTTTFDSGFMTLTDPGKEALTTAVTDVVSSIKDFATVTEINITAIGYTDPAKINTRWVPKLTQQYIDNIGQLPDSYKGNVDENSELSEARAKMVTKFLTKQFKQSYPNVQIIENASGKGDTDCQNKKPQEYSKCRKVEISIKVTGTSTESE